MTTATKTTGKGSWAVLLAPIGVALALRGIQALTDEHLRRAAELEELDAAIVARRRELAGLAGAGEVPAAATAFEDGRYAGRAEEHAARRQADEAARDAKRVTRRRRRRRVAGVAALIVGAVAGTAAVRAAESSGAFPTSAVPAEPRTPLLERLSGFLGAVLPPPTAAPWPGWGPDGPRINEEMLREDQAPAPAAEEITGCPWQGCDETGREHWTAAEWALHRNDCPYRPAGAQVRH